MAVASCDLRPLPVFVLLWGLGRRLRGHSGQEGLGDLAEPQRPPGLLPGQGAHPGAVSGDLEGKTRDWYQKPGPPHPRYSHYSQATKELRDKILGASIGNSKIVCRLTMTMPICLLCLLNQVRDCASVEADTDGPRQALDKMTQPGPTWRCRWEA